MPGKGNVPITARARGLLLAAQPEGVLHAPGVAESRAEPRQNAAILATRNKPQVLVPLCLGFPALLTVVFLCFRLAAQIKSKPGGQAPGLPM